MTLAAPIHRLLETLIAFPTVSRESNLGLIEWARDRLSAQGVRSRLTYDKEHIKANLFATFGGDARATGGIVLSGHTDVVPVEGQEWRSDPFQAICQDERIYGRGAADMKGFLAVVLAAVPDMLGRPFHLALSYDEEIGCLGVPGLLADLQAAGIKPDACIVGEPTDMTLVSGHKGASVHRCKVLGRAAHSARAPQGVNAVVYAARLIARLDEIVVRLRDGETKHHGYDVPYTTVNIGVITGGIASNIVAERCEFRFDIRHLPWTAPSAIVAELETYAHDVLLPEMRDLAPEARISFDIVGSVPALATDETAAIVQRAARLLRTDETPHQVGFGTEAGLFAAAGIPTVIIGPGSICQAHKPDEFVAVAQLARCEQFLQALIEDSACD